MRIFYMRYFAEITRTKNMALAAQVEHITASADTLKESMRGYANLSAGNLRTWYAVDCGIHESLFTAQ
jgi:hypothetical protein